MNINIAICDDNKIFIDNMKTKIIKISKNMKYNTEIFIYTDGNILLNEICEEKESIDVLMLDIDMPHISGLQIANEIRKRNLNICMYDGRVMYIGKSLKNFLEELDDNNFIQIYSGCAVNIKYVSEFSKVEITLDNNEKLPVSRTRMSDVKKTLLKYWREKV